MVARKQKNSANRRKLHFPTNATDFKLSDRELNVVIREAALVYGSLLKLKIEAAQREYKHMMNTIEREALDQIKNRNGFKEVKVEKNEERFRVKVRCERGGHRVVQVLEALEEMGLDVVHARVSSQISFSMEAIVVPLHGPEPMIWTVHDITTTLLHALL